jgi:hypothetical protein
MIIARMAKESKMPFRCLVYLHLHVRETNLEGIFVHHKYESSDESIIASGVSLGTSTGGQFILGDYGFRSFETLGPPERLLMIE